MSKNIEQTLNQILQELKANANPSLIEKRRKMFGVVASNALGLTQSQLNQILKGKPKSRNLALALYHSGIYEARILCAKMYPPKQLQKEDIDLFVNEIENWEICDTFSMKLFSSYSDVETLIKTWAKSDEEFVKRSAYATLASLCSKKREAPNYYFMTFFPLITEGAMDERLYVKKAVSWALRSIGKRNVDLKQEAIGVANTLLKTENKAAIWIAKDVLKELQGEKLSLKNLPADQYK